MIPCLRNTYDYTTPLPGRILVPLDYRDTRLGRVLHIQISRVDGKRMGWRQILKVMHASYPGQWAVQVFPPEGHVLDMIHAYHLFVLPGKPEGLALGR